MSIPVQIDLLGADDLQRALDKIDEKVARKIVKDAVKLAANLVLQDAQSRAPRDTGNLAENIRVNMRTKHGQPHAYVTSKFDGHYYGAYEELGSKHNEATEFLRNALKDQAFDCLAIMEVEIRSGLESLA